MGRSHGGLTANIHALVDSPGLPIALKLTEGRSAKDMLNQVQAGQIPLGDRAGARPRAGEAGPGGQRRLATEPRRARPLRTA